MKAIRRISPVLSCALVVAGLAFLALAGEEKAGEKVKKKGPPPLVVDKEAPLLLEEPGGSGKEAAPGYPANDACLVCHVNFKKEPLALIHGKEEIGCVDCHGDSLEHRNDENNTTPPEMMYPLEKIDRACRMCHKKHDVPASKVVARWLQRCPEKKDTKKIVCTDCHGMHRLKVRTVRWNKKTGELLPK